MGLASESPTELAQGESGPDPGSSLALQASTVAPGAPQIPYLQDKRILSSSVLILAIVPCFPWTLGGKGLSGSV